MEKKVYITTAVLIVGLVALYGWLHRPSPIPLDDPKAQPIKDVLGKSYKIEMLLRCDPESNVNLLAEVYRDTADYKQIKNHRVIITNYLGEKAVNEAGYLTFMRAYYLWQRSGDPYPRESPDANPTLEHLYTLANTLVPTAKPVRDCPDPLPEPQLRYQRIAIREDRAITVYVEGPYQIEAILRHFDNAWFIVSSRALSISP
jgi:hypothetical protein